MPIRPFRPEDLEKLKQITAICFDGVSIDRNIEAAFGQINGRDWKFRKLRHIDADVAGDHANGVFVFETDAGDVVGYITTRLDHESGIGWIPNIAVHPAHQGSGTGRQLMEHAIEFMRTEGMQAAKIETLKQNDVGSNFYPSVGFEEVGLQIHYLMRL
ncbi:MAG: GNAT family N-acetyltransferase [Gemmatimonadetes bacterium]|nr:GNAT family N-acetyltransferase [Gemmatimonadota bacterium]MBT4609882.1 GNAT family N-acetyltransferase [Gemmatimonadota bacterium]MBT5056163.1 GNAT family N-acetyltransferase [Gemmatimonadota bacterium]MBT5142587.1 GNAT family N-acetyltransferase [Gemmatimonadota bacterium]MBT5592180.1 GNAT family N-acetyltransferase [Gemmatimonadota bacterium]